MTTGMHVSVWHSLRHGRARAKAIVVLLLMPLVCSAFACRREAKIPPNVVLISIDCMNQRQFATALERGYAPAMLRLAQDSMNFTRGYAHAPWTTPSHMSMFTGLYPSQHGRDIPHRLIFESPESYDREPRFETLAERLERAGYEAVAFVGSGSISAVFGLAQGFSRYMESERDENRQDLPYVDAGVSDWLEHRSNKPFFLFYHTYELHWKRPEGLGSDRAVISHVDRYLSQLFENLRRRGLYENTLIILTGDHGSKMIRTTGKCCMHGVGHYEENLRVPFVVKFPGGERRGSSDMLVRHVDLLPTVLDLLGIPADGYSGPGLSIVDRLNTPAELRTPIFSFSEADGLCLQRQGLVDAGFKYIYTPTDPLHTTVNRSARMQEPVCRRPACQDPDREEFYDLRSDPFEENNLMSGPLSTEHKRKLDQMRGEMEAHLNVDRHYAIRVLIDEPTDVDLPAEGLPESVEKSLKALGYIE